MKPHLTSHGGLNKMSEILQTFWNELFQDKSYEFRLIFHWNFQWNFVLGQNLNSQNWKDSISCTFRRAMSYGLSAVRVFWRKWHCQLWQSWHHDMRVVMMPTLSSLEALEVVIKTTSSATSYDKVGIMITLSFQCVFHDNTQQSKPTDFLYIVIYRRAWETGIPWGQNRQGVCYFTWLTHTSFFSGLHNNTWLGNPHNSLQTARQTYKPHFLKEVPKSCVTLYKYLKYGIITLKKLRPVSISQTHLISVGVCTEQGKTVIKHTAMIINKVQWQWLYRPLATRFAAYPGCRWAYLTKR